ncbi:O-antigen ligase family protein [Candidatus Avelusimicrobium alvi]|uniref:O-antigen ligase family protein n=1 Tax=Candidatus Avelusimicrobium alvi TaxID=3416221 RepID=UPI003D0D4E89
MLNLTKAAKETIYMKIMRVLLAMCFLVVPLVFFTDLTANPFFVQNVLLYVLIALLYGTLAVKFLRSKDIDFTKTFFDLAFFVYVITCIVGWLSAVSSAPQAMRQTMFYGLLNYGSLLFIVSLGAYMLSKNVVFSGTIESKTNYILLFLAWGALWYFLPMLKTHLLSDGLFAQMFDWYGLVLWILGVWLGVRVLRKLTQENILVLMFVAVFLACCYGVLQALGLEFLWPFEINQFATKAFSTFGNPNFLSSAVVMLLPSLLVYYMRTDSKKDFIVYGLLVLVYILFLSFGLARSCWIGAACGLVMMWMFGTLRALIWQRKGRVFLLALLAVGVGWGSVYVDGTDAPSPVAKRAAELAQVTPSNFTLKVDREDIFQSLHQRLFMWDVSKEIFLERPVLGSGLGNFQMAFEQNQPKTLLRYPNLRELKTITPAPHNELFFQLGQGGIVGLGLFLFMFMVLFLEVRDFAAHKKEGDKKQLLQALFCGILGMLADNMLNISLHAVVPAFIFWWMVGAEVSGVGKEERRMSITANPVTKTVALAILGASAAVLVWQGLWLASEYRSFLGQKDIAVKNYDSAAQNLALAQSLYPANTEAGFRLGNVLLAQGKYKEALSAFETTMSAAAYHEEVYFHAALAALGTHDNKKAVHYLMDNLKLHPYHLQGYVMLLQLLDENVIYADESALALMERGLTLFPYETSLWRMAGEIYQKLGDTEYAKNTYKRGLTVDTLDRELLQRLDALYPRGTEKPAVIAQARRLQRYQEKAGKFDKMSAYYQHRLRSDVEAYIEEYPEDTNGRILLARVLSLGGNDIKAKEVLESVLKEYPDDLWANLALSTLYYKAEDEANAKRYLQNALFYYPQNTLATARLEALS